MIYGITGNEQKEELWPIVADLTDWMDERQIPFRFPDKIAHGLADRELQDTEFCQQYAVSDLTSTADMIISFGGDGTMLHTAYSLGTREIPLLGVNLGRLGFLADVETDHLYRTIEQLEAGDYRIETRLVLEAQFTGIDDDASRWALNDFVIDKSGSASMISIRISVDGRPLNTYRADGVIVATPTGSTAYSLSAGGPIMEPGSGVIVVTPIAPHTLTVRPIVLPASSTIRATVTTGGQPYVFAGDGRSEIVETLDSALAIQRADHRVHLVKLTGNDYFHTLRTKLSWGQGYTM
jgi:NAD+ kinase